MPALNALGARSCAVFALLLVSCSAHLRPGIDPTNPRELSRYALVIEETPEGQVTHSWVPASDFDRERYSHRAAHQGVEGGIVHVAFSRDCDEENLRCEEMCKASLKGRNWSHVGKGSKAEICRDRCRPAYLDCSRLREQAEAMKFPVIDDAVDWLKRHRKEVLVGTVVVISGVAFTVIVAGSGGTALILVPAVLLTSSELSSMPCIAAGKP